MNNKSRAEAIRDGGIEGEAQWVMDNLAKLTGQEIREAVAADIILIDNVIDWFMGDTK
jgi:hypothetical protein